MTNKKKIERVVFDFDNTLFDTEAKKSALYRMAEAHGYSRADAKEIYRAARTAQEKIMMSLSSYVHVLRERLHAEGKEFLSGDVSRIIGTMEEGDGLLPGAKELLRYCLSKSLPCYLLSLGVKAWQEEKVKQSGITEFFPRHHIVYTDTLETGKIDVLHKLFGRSFDGAGTVIFNDKPDETAALLTIFPELLAFVRIETRDERYAPDTYRSLADQFPGRVFLSEQLSQLHDLFARIYEHAI